MMPQKVTTIYVSQTNGDDDYTGFYPELEKKGPVASLEKAFLIVEELRPFGIMQPVTIYIMDEEYYIQKSIKIKSGVFGITITGNNPVLNGGIKIEGWKHDTFNGMNCFSAYVPQVKENGMWFTDLYVDSKRASITQYPEEGYLKPEKVENESSELMASSKWFIAKQEDLSIIKGFRNFSDCSISFSHYWIDEHSPIESYDLDTGKITMKYHSRFTIELTHPASALEYKIDNVGEAFKNKNEWYLNRTNGVVYYIPRDNTQTPESITAYAPCVSKLFEVIGEENKKVNSIHFKNLTFANTKGEYSSMYKSSVPLPDPADDFNGYASDGQSVCSAHGSIEFTNANLCSVADCTLRNIGVHAIAVNSGCSDIRITNNAIFDCGAGGIKVDGDIFGSDVSRHTNHIIISNNTITDLGNRYFAACGILLMHTYSNTVSHNEISYLYYTGISCGWVWGYGDSICRDNLIEKNYIHHLGQGKLSDMGGIYLLGKQPGTIVTGNVIHDVESRHYGGWGLYTDEGSSYITIENNICYNMTCNAYHQHYGSMNTIRNNIFISKNDAAVCHSRNEMHIGILLEKNIIVSDGKSIYSVGYNKKQDAFVHVIQANNNLLFDISNENPDIFVIDNKHYKLSDVQKEFSIESESIIADPCFVDAQNNNFSLKPESPALALGFQPIDTRDVGVIKSDN